MLHALFFLHRKHEHLPLWTPLSTHLQHYKQLILTPERGVGRKRVKDSSEQRMISVADNAQLIHWFYMLVKMMPPTDSLVIC